MVRARAWTSQPRCRIIGSDGDRRPGRPNLREISHTHRPAELRWAAAGNPPGAARIEGRPSSVRADLPAPPSGAVPLQPRDRARSRGRRGRDAGHDGGGSTGAAGGGPADRHPSLALPDRAQRIDLAAAATAARPARRGEHPRARGRVAGGPPGDSRSASPARPRPQRSAGAAARGAGDARAKRALLRGDRRGPDLLGRWSAAGRLRGPDRAARARGGQGHGV